MDDHGHGTLVAGTVAGLNNGVGVLGVLAPQVELYAVKVLDQSGILLVAAAGNYGYSKKGTIIFPAPYDSVIVVGAIDQQNNRASFSSVMPKTLEI